MMILLTLQILLNREEKDMKRFILCLILLLCVCVTPASAASGTDGLFETLPQPELNFFIGSLIENAGDDTGEPNSPVPLPSTILFLGTGILAMIGLRRNKLK